MGPIKRPNVIKKRVSGILVLLKRIFPVKPIRMTNPIRKNWYTPSTPGSFFYFCQ